MKNMHELPYFCDNKITYQGDSMLSLNNETFYHFLTADYSCERL